MAVVHGWVSWAVRKPGPADKVYSARNALAGWALHSQEGWQAGSESRLFNTSRNSDGRYTPYAAASWHFSLLLTGELRQHYPIEASTWTSGSRDWNTRYVSVELEGTAAMPINDAQIETLLRLMREVQDAYGLVPVRDGPGRTIHEHRENPAAHTACPSERYVPFYERLRVGTNDGGEEMTEEQVRQIVRDELAKWEREAGAEYARFVRGMSVRLQAMSRVTDLNVSPDVIGDWLGRWPGGER